MSNYNLEEVFFERCEKYRNRYECIKNIYHYNKMIIVKNLENVNRYFTHFSRHDASHSESIINALGRMLTDEQIEKLSTTDIYIILMSGYLHDYSMILKYEKVKKWFESEEAKEFLKELKNDKYYSKDVEYLELEKLSAKSVNEVSWPLSVVNSVNRVLSAYFRKNHGKISKDIITNGFEDEDINLNPNKFLSTCLENILGNVCEMHQSNFNEIMKMQKTSNGVANDEVHPRLLAVLLRIGDLLDLDTNRFDEYLISCTSGKLEADSELHYKKHISIKELYISPMIIHIKVEAEDEKVVRLIRDWKRWLEEEIDNYSNSINELIPDGWNFSIPRVEFIVNKTNSEEEYIDKNLVVELSSQKSLELIQGASIYNDNLSFLREFIQNSIDSIKKKFWDNAIQQEYYLSENKNIEQIKENINLKFIKGQYFDEIQKYKIKIHFFDCRDEKEFSELENYYDSENFKREIFKKKIVVVFEDNGVGISKKCLENRILEVGKHDKNPDEYEYEINNMPSTLRPTSNFGIGLHSAFLVSDYIIYQTKTLVDECGREIIINSEKGNGWVECNKWKRNTLRNTYNGTRSYICVYPEKINILESNPFNLIENNNRFMLRKNIDKKMKSILIQVLKSKIEKICIKPFCDIQIFDYYYGKKNNYNICGNYRITYKNENNSNCIFFNDKQDKRNTNVIRDDKNYYIEFMLKYDKNSNIREFNQNNSTYLLVLDKISGTRLQLNLQPYVSKKKKIITLFKGMNIESSELKDELGRYILGGTNVIIDYSLNNVAKYLKINRDNVSNEGFKELTNLFKEMINVALESVYSFIKDQFKDKNNVIINEYYKLNEYIDKIAAIMVNSYTKMIADKSFDNNNEIIEKLETYLKENRLDLKMDSADKYRLFVEVFVKKVARCIWNNDIRLYDDCEKICYDDKKSKFYSILEECFKIIVLKLEINEYIKNDEIHEEIKDIFSSFSSEIGADALYFLMTKYGKFELPKYKTYFINIPALNFMLYHLKYGQMDILNDEDYKKIMQILSDEYVKDDEYGNREDDERYNRCFEFAVKKRKNDFITYVWGSDLVRDICNAFFITDCNDEKKVIINSIYQIDKLKFIRVNKKCFIKMICSNKDSKKFISEIDDEIIQNIFLKGIIDYGYLDVNYKDYYINYDANYYCIPAINKYSNIVIEKLPIEYDIFYRNSQFAKIYTEGYIMLPINRDILEEWLDRLVPYYRGGVDVSEIKNNSEEMIDKFAKDINLEEIIEYTEQNSKNHSDRNEMEKEYKELLKEILMYIFTYIFK